MKIRVYRPSLIEWSYFDCLTIKILDNHQIPRKYRDNKFIFCIDYPIPSNDYYYYIYVVTLKCDKYILVDFLSYNKNYKHLKYSYFIENYCPKISKTT